MRDLVWAVTINHSHLHLFSARSLLCFPCHRWVHNIVQALEDKYGGWLSPEIVDSFETYADTCFREFGGKVAQGFHTRIERARVFYWDGSMLAMRR